MTANGTRIRSVARGCDLLLWLAGTPHGATAKEAAFATTIPLPTAYHLLNTLVDAGLLTKGPQRRYVLGQGSARLAQAYLRGPAVPDAILLELDRLADRTNGTTELADWGETGIRNLASSEGCGAFRVAALASGAYEAAHARATGKVLLAYARPGSREAYLERHPLTPCTARTIRDGADLELELELVRERGYAWECEEFSEGVSSIAVPILRAGEIVFSLGISGRTEHLARAEEKLRRELLDAVATVEAHSSRDHRPSDPMLGDLAPAYPNPARIRST